MRFWMMLPLLAVLLGPALAAGPPRRGASVRAPGADLRKLIVWGSECRAPEGQGLAFGGQHQRANDGRPHTRLLQGGKWVAIHEELRKANPLQTHRDNLWTLRARLRDALGRFRYIFFEGRTREQETAFLNENVNVELKDLAAELAKARIALVKIGGLDEHAAGQVKAALAHIEAAAPTVRPLTGRVDPARLAAMRRAQISLEQAAEALDAEPPPRVCSKVVYDPKMKQYVIFGGGHFDYVTNDLWVFDPAKRRWFQRHPASAPSPRANHAISSDGKGKITIFSGYIYQARFNYGGSSYGSAGPEKWTYDLASNTWTTDPGQKPYPVNTREYRAAKFLPEYYMKGKRPDAAANEARLKAIPVNTWVSMNPPQRPQKEQMSRGWGTSVLDSDNDLFLQWGGGHSAHGGTDVLHYHFATNRWEQPYPIEYCLGLIRSTSHYPGGYNFNGHPWIIMHAYKSYAYEPALKRMVVTGRNWNWKYNHDFYFYLYDGLTGTWGARYPLHRDIGGVHYFLNSRVSQGDNGLLYWTSSQKALRLNTKALKWEPIRFEGKLSRCGTDGGGLVYDPKRKRMMMVTKPWKSQNQSIFKGKIHVLDLETKKVVVLTPKGSAKLKNTFLREAVYNPEADIFLWAWQSPGKMLAYEPKGNRWVTLDVAGNAPFSFSSGHVYDAKRKLHWVATGGGTVHCLRLDVKTANMKTLE
jgi:galactose oxidase-like protein